MISTEEQALAVRLGLERLRYKIRGVDLSSQLKGKQCSSLSQSVTWMEAANFLLDGTEQEAAVVVQVDVDGG